MPLVLGGLARVGLGLAGLGAAGVGLKVAGLSLTKILEAIWSFFISKLLTALIPDTVSERFVSYLISQPSSVTQGVADGGAVVSAIALALIGLTLSVAIAQGFYLATAEGDITRAFDAMKRGVLAASFVLAWPTVAGWIMHAFALVASGLIVTDEVERAVGGLIAAIVGGGLVAALTTGTLSILIALPLIMAGVAMVLLLFILKVMVTAGVYVLYIAMPLAIALYPIERLSFVAASALKAFMGLLTIPLVWAICFLTFGAVLGSSERVGVDLSGARAYQEAAAQAQQHLPQEQRSTERCSDDPSAPCRREQRRNGNPATFQSLADGNPAALQDRARAFSWPGGPVPWAAQNTAASALMTGTSRYRALTANSAQKAALARAARTTTTAAPPRTGGLTDFGFGQQASVLSEFAAIDLSRIPSAEEADQVARAAGADLTRLGLPAEAAAAARAAADAARIRRAKPSQTEPADGARLDRKLWPRRTGAQTALCQRFGLSVPVCAQINSPNTIVRACARQVGVREPACDRLRFVWADQEDLRDGVRDGIGEPLPAPMRTGVSPMQLLWGGPASAQQTRALRNLGVLTALTVKPANSKAVGDATLTIASQLQLLTRKIRVAFTEIPELERYTSDRPGTRNDAASAERRIRENQERRERERDRVDNIPAARAEITEDVRRLNAQLGPLMNRCSQYTAGPFCSRAEMYAGCAALTADNPRCRSELAAWDKALLAASSALRATDREDQARIKATGKLFRSSLTASERQDVKEAAAAAARRNPGPQSVNVIGRRNARDSCGAGLRATRSGCQDAEEATRDTIAACVNDATVARAREAASDSEDPGREGGGGQDPDSEDQQSKDCEAVTLALTVLASGIEATKDGLKDLDDEVAATVLQVADSVRLMISQATDTFDITDPVLKDGGVVFAAENSIFDTVLFKPLVALALLYLCLRLPARLVDMLMVVRGPMSGTLGKTIQYAGMRAASDVLGRAAGVGMSMRTGGAGGPAAGPVRPLGGGPIGGPGGGAAATPVGAATRSIADRLDGLGKTRPATALGALGNALADPPGRAWMGARAQSANAAVRVPAQGIVGAGAALARFRQATTLGSTAESLRAFAGAYDARYGGPQAGPADAVLAKIGSGTQGAGVVDDIIGSYDPDARGVAPHRTALDQAIRATGISREQGDAFIAEHERRIPASELRHNQAVTAAHEMLGAADSVDRRGVLTDVAQHGVSTGANALTPERVRDEAVLARAKVSTLSASPERDNWQRYADSLDQFAGTPPLRRDATVIATDRAARGVDLNDAVGPAVNPKRPPLKPKDPRRPNTGPQYGLPVQPAHEPAAPASPPRDKVAEVLEPRNPYTS